MTPYKSKDRWNLCQRGVTRRRRHGDWRQIVIDCGGMCVWRDPDGTLCGRIEHLEFHEVFGEDDNGSNSLQGKMQERILLCPKHHALSHPQRMSTEFNLKKSRVMGDIDEEILNCGGYDQWLEKYKLDNTRWGYKLRKEET